MKARRRMKFELFVLAATFQMVVSVVEAIRWISLLMGEA